MKKLAQMVRDQMDERGLGARSAAKEIGISHATVIRILADMPVDINTIEAVSKWLGVTLIDVIDQKPGDANLAAKLAVLINRAPDLGASLTEALIEVEEGRMSAEDLRDIADFINYKLTHHQIRGRVPAHKEGSEAGR